MSANLGSVKDPNAVKASTWYDLLVGNYDLDPASFYFDPENKRLYLHRMMDNRGITPAMLREQFERFCDNIRGSEKLWSFTE
jgi:hypothetical protein